MNNKFKPITDERPTMIVLGIIAFYALIVGFVIYLFLLHKISTFSALVSVIVFTLIYLPRLLIIKKLSKKDIIRIEDDGININNNLIYFTQIKDYKVEKKKPSVVFFMNNSMIVYQEATFHLKLENSQVSFFVIGTEKIQLLKEFLSQLLSKF